MILYHPSEQRTVSIFHFFLEKTKCFLLPSEPDEHLVPLPCTPAAMTECFYKVDCNLAENIPSLQKSQNISKNNARRRKKILLEMGVPQGISLSSKRWMLKSSEITVTEEVLGMCPWCS